MRLIDAEYHARRAGMTLSEYIHWVSTWKIPRKPRSIRRPTMVEDPDEVTARVEARMRERLQRTGVHKLFLR